jgi:hypothetical protein
MDFAPDPRPGRLRRRIALSAESSERATGWVEDDFHHFGVTIEHRAGVVTRVTAVAPRAPWSTCPAAVLPLRAIEGQSLIERASDIGKLIDMRVQCTHLFDLAGLVLAQASRGGKRRYEAIVPDRRSPSADGAPPAEDRGIVTLDRDGERVMAWDLNGSTITAPEPWSGRSLDYGFRAMIEQLPLEPAEQAFIMRRAVMVARGRGIDLDEFASVDDLGMLPVCHSSQSAVRAHALRIRGATRDYSADATGMLEFAGPVDQLPGQGGSSTPTLSNKCTP